MRRVWEMLVWKTAPGPPPGPSGRRRRVEPTARLHRARTNRSGRSPHGICTLAVQRPSPVAPVWLAGQAHQAAARGVIGAPA